MYWIHIHVKGHKISVHPGLRSRSGTSVGSCFFWKDLSPAVLNTISVWASHNGRRRLQRRAGKMAAAGTRPASARREGGAGGAPAGAREGFLGPGEGSRARGGGRSGGARLSGPPASDSHAYAGRRGPRGLCHGLCQVAPSSWPPPGTCSGSIRWRRDLHRGGKARGAQAHSRVPRLPRGAAAHGPRVLDRERTARRERGRPAGGPARAAGRFAPTIRSGPVRSAGAAPLLLSPLASQQIPPSLTFTRGGFGGLHPVSKPRHPQDP